MKHRYFLYRSTQNAKAFGNDFVVQTQGKLCYYFRDGELVCAFWGVPEGMVEVVDGGYKAILREVMARSGAWRRRNQLPLT